jgi:plastocyanin domain-containing protein
MRFKAKLLIAGTSFILAASLPVDGQKPRSARAKDKQPRIQQVTIALTEKGYEPASFKLRRGVLARITFVRRVEVTCATEVVLPDYEIKRELPLNEPVVVEFTPGKSGEFSFACGMNMVRGKIIVR